MVETISQKAMQTITLIQTREFREKRNNNNNLKIFRIQNNYESITCNLNVDINIGRKYAYQI